MFKTFSSKFAILIGAIIFAFLGLFIGNCNTKISAATTEIIEISNQQQLVDFANQVNSGNSFLNKEVKLTSDIDLNGIENWTQIGTMKNMFKGFFNGNNHTISNLKSTNGGLFGFSSGYIQNLIVKSEITLNESSKYVGGLVNYVRINADLVSKINLANCVSYTTFNIPKTVDRITYIGGMIGRFMGAQNCLNSVMDNCIAYVKSNLSSQVLPESFGCFLGDISRAIYTNCFAYTDKNLNNKNQENLGIKVNATTNILTESQKINFDFCTTCMQIYLKIDNSHNHIAPEPEPVEPVKKSITPKLAQTSYTYDINGINLLFQEIEKIDIDDVVYFTYDKVNLEVGNHSISVSLAGANADKYTLSSNSVSFEITPKPVTISVENQTSIYGNMINKIAYTPEKKEYNLQFGLFKNNQQITNYLADKYDIKILSFNQNFDITMSVPATYTITKRIIDIQTTSFTYEFNNTARVPTLILTNILSNDSENVSYILEEKQCVNKGNYTLNVALIGTGASNYTLKTNQININITPKNVFAIWSEKELIFNNEIQYPTATIDSGIESYDIIFSYSGGGKNAGTNYSVSVVCEDTNFNILNTAKTYIISKRPIDIQTTSFIYEFNNTARVPTLDLTNIVPSDSENVSYLLEDKQCVNKGNYTLNVALSGAGASNYTLKTNQININITPKNVSAIWGEKELIFNNEIQHPTATIDSGIANYDIAFSYSGGGKNAGTNYSVSVICEDANFNILNTAKTYKISKRPIDIQTTSFTYEFNNTARVPTLDLTNIVSSDSENVSYKLEDKECINKGNYILNVTLSGAGASNYTLKTNQININITPKNVSAIWNEKELIFNNEIQYPTATIDSGIANYDIVFSYSGGGKNADTNYSVSIVCEDANFNIANTAKTYKITPKKVTLKWIDENFIYNGKIQAPKYAYEDFLYDFDITLTGQGITAANHTVTAATSDKNIELINTKFTYSIDFLTCNIVWTNTEFIYSGENFCPKADINLPKNIDKNLIPLVVNGASSVIGMHTATARTTNANVILNNTTCDFEIKAKTIVCETQENDIAVEISGAINNDITVKSVSNDVQKVLPQGYKVLRAFELKSLDKNTTLSSILSMPYVDKIYFTKNEILTSDVSTEYNINITLKDEISIEDLHIFQIGESVNELNFTTQNKTLSFGTNQLGLICLANISGEMAQIKVLLGVCFGSIALIAIVMVGFMIYYKKGKKVYFKAKK